MAITYLSGGRIQGSSTELKTVTYSGVLDDWVTDSSGDGSISESSDIVTMDIRTRNQNQTVTNDLGATLSDSAWVMRCKVIFTTLTNGGGSTIYLELGMGHTDATTGMSNDGVDVDFIGLQMRTVSSDHGWGGADYENGQNSSLDNPENNGSGTDQMFATDQVVGTYYVEIKRLTATSMSIGLYSDSGFSKLIDPILTRVVPSGVTGLRHIRVGNAGRISEGSTGNVIGGTVSEFKIWNAVTSATTDEKASLVTATNTIGSAGNWDTTSNVTIGSGGTPSGLGNYYWESVHDSSNLSLTDGYIFGTGGDFTVSCWINPDSLTNNGNLINRTYPLPDNSKQKGNQIELQTNGTNIYVQLGTSGGDLNANAAHNMTTGGGWYLFVQTFDRSAGETKIYVFGTGTTDLKITEQDNNVIDTGIDQDNHSVLNSGGAADGFDGQMMEFTTWDKVLSSANMTALFNSGVGVLANTIEPANILVYYAPASSGFTNQAPTSVSNLPVGSRFEETDTRKIFRMKDGDWVEKGTA